MGVKAAEIAIIKELADKQLPAIIKAEISRLPAAFSGAAQALESVLEPMLIKALDDLIAKIPVDAA